MTSAGRRSPLSMVLITAIPIFLAVGNQSMISIALPAIGADLGELQHLPWLVTGYMLSLTIAGPVYGLLGDSFGRVRMLQAALGVYVLGSAVALWAEDLRVLALARLIQGVGGGGLMSLPQAMIGQMVAARQQGRAQGYVATIATLASTGGPLLGGLLVVAFGWRSLFGATIPLALVAMAILSRLRLPPGDTRRMRFDLTGFLWLAALVLAWTLGLEALKLPGGAGLAALGGLAGLGALWGLVRSQRRVADPLFPPRLLAEPRVARTSAMVVCHGAALVSLVMVLPLFQTILRGDDTVQVTFSLLAMTAASGVGGVLAGNLVSLTGRTALFPTLSLPVAAAGIVTLALAGEHLTAGALVAVYAAIGLSMGGVMPVSNATIQLNAPADLRGRASGAVTFFRSIGGVLGTAAVSVVLFGLAPAAAGAPGWDGAFRGALLTIAAFVALGWLSAATTPARRP